MAPVLAARCSSCHRPGGIAPVPRLGGYDDAADAAGKIRLTVQTRDMPPWGADNTGICHTWRDALWLSDSEVRTIVAWVDGGHPAGSPQIPNPPSAPEKPRFEPSGVVLDTKVNFTPGLGPSAYRCFVADPALAEDRLVTAFRVSSTDARSVAQVTLYALDTPASEAQAARLDESEDGPGYLCYGSSRTSGARLLTSWTWDSAVLRMPAGTGIRLHAGHKIVVQVHYDIIASGLGHPTRTLVELETSPGVREVSFLAISPGSLRLPPGRRLVEASEERPILAPVKVLGAAPRMHGLGRTMQIDLLRGAQRECLGSFDHWHFYRQRLFIYDARPVTLQPGDRLRLSCVYNTQSRQAPTEMGEGIDDEECLLSLLVEQ